MKDALIECVPNFSCGRCDDTISALVRAASDIKGVSILDVSSDKSHNRSVITIAGTGTGVSEAAFLMCREAAERIDLRLHQGAHPRIGAADVIPFVPLKGTTMEECIEISKAVGKRIADELLIPVFLYEYAASAPERRNLANIRKNAAIWKPDCGGGAHPSAGAAAVGARGPLIAFNVNLNTADIGIAKKTAAVIRSANGGLKAVKAIGLFMEETGLSQVSMNLTNYNITPPLTALNAVKKEAARMGASVIGIEIIGLAPRIALAGLDIDTDKFAIESRGFGF